MRIRVILLFFLFILLCQSCAHKIKINAIPASDQVVDNKGFVTSELTQVVSLSYYDSTRIPDDKIMFTIILENCGEKPVQISNDNISVFFKGNKSGWTPKKITLLSPSEFTNEIVSRYTKKPKFINYTTTPHPDSPKITGGGFDGFPELTKFSEELKKGHDSSVDSISNIKNDKLKSDREQLKYSLQRIILKPQIIMPDDSITSVFAFGTNEIGKSAGKFIITVLIDGEEHKFTFSRSI